MFLKRRDFLKLAAGGLFLSACMPKTTFRLVTDNWSRNVPEFITLWTSLTGDSQPDVKRATLLYRHFSLCHPDQLDKVLTVWARRPTETANLDNWVLDNLLSETSSRNTCKDIALTILLGTLYVNGKSSGAPLAASENDLKELEYLYESGSFWKFAKTHALGIPSNTFGEWSQPPREV